MFVVCEEEKKNKKIFRREWTKKNIFSNEWIEFEVDAVRSKIEITNIALYILK